MSCRVAYARDEFEDDQYPGLFITVANFLLFQGTWLACVMGAASDRPGVGVIVACVVVAWHLNAAVRPATEFKVLLLTGLIGAAWETLLVSQNWLDYQGSATPGVPPLWTIALWLAFATTLNVSLNGLKGRTFLAAMLGSIIGPVAWYVAERMGALTLTEGGYTLIVIGAGSALLLPLISAIAGWAVTLDAARPASKR